MIKKLFQGKSIIRATREGSIEFLMIYVCAVVFILLPLVMMAVNSLIGYVVAANAKDCLELSSINAYSMIDVDSLGRGEVRINPYESEKYFLDDFNNLTGKNRYIGNDASVSINHLNGVISIISQVTVTGPDKNPVTVKSNMEFVIDPLFGG